MAVPPDGAQVVFEALFKTLEGISYESIEPNIDVEKRIQAMEDKLEADKEDTLF